MITASNTFPHIQQLDDFVEGLKVALKPGGAFVIEAHYLLDIVEQVAFDTIYHEACISLGARLRRSGSLRRTA